MIYYDDYMLEFRGSDDPDPEAIEYATEADDHYRVLLPVTGILPSIRVIGDIDQAGSGRLFGQVDKRFEATIDPKPEYVLSAAAIADTRLPAFGLGWHLSRRVIGWGNLFLYAAYKVGSDPTDGAIPRSRLNPATGLFEDTFWTTEVTLPLLIVVSGEISASRNDDGTVTYSSFKISSADLL